MPGAFAKSLVRWQEKVDPIPVIWNHMWDNPEAHIGAAAPGDAVETDDGLRRQVAASTSTTRSPRRCTACCRSGAVKEFSFGYDGARRRTAKDGALDLLEIDLFELGPTLKGMNPETELLAVKALAEATDPPDRAGRPDRRGQGRRPPLARKPSPRCTACAPSSTH